MKNRVGKYICFKRRFFSVFCGFLFDFVTILDGPKSSKIQNAAPGALQKFTKKRPRCLKIEFRDAFWTHLSSKAGFERVLGGFWEDLGWFLRVWGGSWESFGKVLGAFMVNF